jgi:uncharacterized RDD family membrane protein YckC
MDEETNQPAKPVNPPPDLPKADLPPPSLEPVNTEPAQSAGTPVVNVRIREAGAAEDDASKAGARASLNTRIVAAVIDSLVSSGLMIAASFVLPHFAEKIAWLLGVGYMVTRDSLPFLGGQSVGKKAMKLRAVNREGQSLTGNWEAALIRNAILMIPFFGLIELFVLLTREGKPEQGVRLGDEWAKTKVIVAETPPEAK